MLRPLACQREHEKETSWRGPLHLFGSTSPAWTLMNGKRSNVPDSIRNGTDFPIDKTTRSVSGPLTNGVHELDSSRGQDRDRETKAAFIINAVSFRASQRDCTLATSYHPQLQCISNQCTIDQIRRRHCRRWSSDESLVFGGVKEQRQRRKK